MKTKQIYYQDPYLKELECEVLLVENKINLTDVVLDQTIFYPEGGGQPSDQGRLGEVKVEFVRMTDGEIVHQVKGDLGVGDKVKAILNWDKRYKNMKVHTAGHLVHDVLMSVSDGLVPAKGGHGKKAFLEYEGELDLSKEELEQRVNGVLEKDLNVVTKEASYEELEKDCQFMPGNLPKDKPLRMIKIGDFPAMPDGGVHVKSTREIGRVVIISVSSQKGKVNIRYGVGGV